MVTQWSYLQQEIGIDGIVWFSADGRFFSKFLLYCRMNSIKNRYMIKVLRKLLVFLLVNIIIII